MNDWAYSESTLMSTPSPKPSDTANYTGIPAPSPTDGGTLQTGGWADLDGQQTFPRSFPTEVFEAIPANVRVQLALASGITRLGPSQYAVSLSLSGTDTVQLTPNAADAQQDETSAVSPNSFTWSFVSRNVNVATVNSSGLITAVGRGQCEVRVISSRAVNASFVGATPSGTEGTDATIQVTVLA
jgi:hypothetical protein